MMIEIIKAIALLCTINNGEVGIMSTMSINDQLMCQKWYLKCIDSNKSRIKNSYKLKKCVLSRRPY